MLRDIVDGYTQNSGDITHTHLPIFEGVHDGEPVLIGESLAHLRVSREEVAHI